MVSFIGAYPMGGKRTRAVKGEGDEGNADDEKVADGEGGDEAIGEEEGEDEEDYLRERGGNKQVNRAEAGQFEAEPARQNEGENENEIEFI